MVGSQVSFERLFQSLLRKRESVATGDLGARTFGQARALGRPPATDPAEGLGKIPVAEPEPQPNFPPEEPTPKFQIRGPSASKISRPVTENPVVGSLVRAMQKSGLPIAERPNLLLKGSGRVNRILGPEEDLAGPLEKCLRQVRRQREQ
jgi:hypothetical protein